MKNLMPANSKLSQYGLKVIARIVRLGKKRGGIEIRKEEVRLLYISRKSRKNLQIF